MISYPETEQFRTVISHVTRDTRRLEEDQQKPLPSLTFTGTVKLHGTNSALVYQKDGVPRCQSRNNVLAPGKDNAGFYQEMNPIADRFFAEFVLPRSSAIREEYEQGRTVVIYGEWCGAAIQPGVAIHGLPKMFVIFNVRIRDETIAIPEDEDEETDERRTMNDKTRFWLEPKEWSEVKWPEQSIYNIYDFPTYNITIDFNNPKLSQNELIKITEQVERQCPVGSHFGKSGIGEGVVWTEWAETRGGLRFKVKGEEHSVSKVKTLAPVDTEKLANMEEFIEYACTENRMRQGLDYLREQQLTLEMKNVGTFLKWLSNDIIKEEKDTMQQSNIDSKDVMRAVSNKARRWFQLNLV